MIEINPQIVKVSQLRFMQKLTVMLTDINMLRWWVVPCLQTSWQKSTLPYQLHEVRLAELSSEWEPLLFINKNVSDAGPAIYYTELQSIN